MTRDIVLLLTLTTGMLVLDTAAFAQRRRSGPIVSPQVHEDRRVTFRLHAPHAREVAVRGQWADGPHPMSEEDGGVWTVTVGPVEPGVWEYSFHVDGIRIIDPSNPAIKPMRAPRTSILHLPGSPPRIHDFQRVPHGVVRHHSYYSDALDRVRDLVVYTPPQYEKAKDTRFPTLYLQHGMGDNQATWTVHGKAHWILDNLIAREKARPMVVVMMDGHAARWPSGFEANTKAFERDLLEEVLPFVEANYRVQSDASGRAIAGLSMGGGQSLTIGLGHTDRFAWVAGFSSAPPLRAAIASALDDGTETNERLALLWIACGRDDFLLQRNREFVGLLEDSGIEHEWHLTDGDHSWPVWRGYLADLAPRLFR